MMAHAEGRELFAKDLFGGADLTHRIVGAHRHRICLALAVRAPAADPPDARKS